MLVLHLCLSVDMECGKKTCRVLSKPFSFSSPTKPDRGFETSGDSLRRMVGIQYAQMFTVIGRRHVYEQGRFTIEIEPHDLPVFQTVRVKLTNASTGDFLYEGEFRVTLNPLGIVAEDL